MNTIKFYGYIIATWVILASMTMYAVNCFSSRFNFEPFTFWESISFFVIIYILVFLVNYVRTSIK